MNNSITTFKFFDDKKRRLAIRATDIGNNVMEVTILTCSKKDAFNKKFGRQALNLLQNSDNVTLYGQLLHPQRFKMPFIEFKKEFLAWAHSSLFKLTTRVGYRVITELSRKNERMFVKSANTIEKW